MENLNIQLLSIKRVLNVNEVALLFGFSTGWVYKLVEKNQMPHYKRGGRIMFKRDEVENYILGHKVHTESEYMQMAIATSAKGGVR